MRIAATLQQSLGVVEVFNFIGTFTHHNVDADLVLAHASVRLELCSESGENHLAHLVREDSRSSRDLAEAVLVDATTRS